MIKANENPKTKSSELFHLRFFRLIFKTGKLVIKVDRLDKKMRSINLMNICRAEVSDTLKQNGGKADQNTPAHLGYGSELSTRDEILDQYNL